VREKARVTYADKGRRGAGRGRTLHVAQWQNLCSAQCHILDSYGIKSEGRLHGSELELPIAHVGIA